MSATISAFARDDGFEIDLDVGGMDALGVLVELGAAGAPAHRLDLRHVQDQPLGDEARRGWIRRAKCPD